MNILLVDDERLALESLKKAVSEALPQANSTTFQRASQAINFAETTQIDIAFLDIDMPIMNGLEMARALQALNPQVNIIFVTGFAEYALEAFDLCASAYLTKPIIPEGIAKAMRQLRHPVEQRRVRLRCFGNFEIYCDGAPIHFTLTRTKELLAYLVDRQGSECRKNEIISALFEDEFNVEYYKKLRKDLIDTLAALGLEELILVSRGGLALNKELVQCDYYDYLAGDRAAPPPEYMTQYSFGEQTFAALINSK